MSDAVLSSASGLPLPGPGSHLAAARQGRGLTVADVAQQLKLSPWQVEALESGDYRRLPGVVFVRGFIRNYARLVKLDPASLLVTAEHPAPRAATAGPATRPSAEIPFPVTRTFNWHKYAIGAIAVAVPLVIFEFYYDNAPEPAVNSSQVELPAPQVVAETSPAPTAVVEPGGERPMAIKEALQKDGLQKDTSPVRTQDKALPPTSDAQPIAEARPARGEQVVRLRFARESWVEIRDRNGRKIFSQLNSPGTEQVVSGLPPLSLIVGNANGVQLSHNEQPVNLGPHTKVDVARLTLE